MAAAGKWQALSVNAGELALLAYVPEKKLASDVVFIYLEDDTIQPGHAGLPILEMAMMPSTANAAYLGRPCQNVLKEEEGCKASIWKDERFSPMAIWATVEATDKIKRHFSAKQVVLVGFDGSGVMASLVAARRKDVAALVLVSSVQNTTQWSRLHAAPLADPLNPATEMDKLADIPQYYVIGAADPLAPTKQIEDYAHHFPEGKRPVILRDQAFSRQCCWHQTWPAILQQLDTAIRAQTPQ